MGYLFMRMMSWELGHFITHLFGISFGNSWKLAIRPLVFPMVQILSDSIFIRDVTSRIFSSFELFEFWTFRASSEPSLGSILIFELRASFEPKYELQLLSSEMLPCESKVDPSNKSCLELLV